jgi:hypothetical protein
MQMTKYQLPHHSMFWYFSVMAAVDAFICGFAVAQDNAFMAATNAAVTMLCVVMAHANR